MKPSILLTGCAGFIGSNLLDKLLAEGHTVIGVDDFNDYYDPRIKEKNVSKHLTNPNFKLLKQDINELTIDTLLTSLRASPDPGSGRSMAISSGLPRLPAGEAGRYAPRNDDKIDTIIHLAARAGVRASIQTPLLYNKVNVGGTLSLLELAKNLRIKHFIFGSSSSVYGNNTQAPFREDTPCDQPISPYAATKRSAELLCYTYHHLYEIPTTILRFFTVYGPRNRPDMAAFKFTDAIANGKLIETYGEGTSRDYTYIDDIINGIMMTLKLKNPHFNIINLGNSSPVPLRKFIAAIESTVGKKAILRPKLLPPGDVNTTYADISRAQKLLNWQPKTDLQTGLRRLWEWYTSRNLKYETN